ncbi:hypothetical protein AAFC00_004981 [Neodothiora populina]|uniref:SUN-domain-containing protein n=1 Tax=Neodothiora populina TaxID=2781224 RepID=A0ABR3P462_9PEZI
MKSQIVLLSAAIGLAAATQHRHGHQHVHEKKEATPVADVAYVPGPTVVMYSLNGQTISEDEVMEGIKNGTLIWANGAPQPASEVSSSYSASSTVSSWSSSAAASTTFATSASVAQSSSAAWSSSSSLSSSYSSSYSSSTSSSSAAAKSSSASYSTSSSGSSGADTPFPDGEIDCSDFPSDYGAIHLDYLGLGGWTGIQDPGEGLLQGFSDIMTIASGQCTDGSCCKEGYYCSYACPPGYQKSQWPTKQGSTGQSVGGLLCKNGKLFKTNEDYDTICIKGASAVTVLVRNEMEKDSAVCRTDYPGTESETVPLSAEAGSTTNLTCPDGSSYYKWGNSATSAQYYVNPAGVSVNDACQWGSNANPWGNFAPVNLGVGYSNGAAWLSIFQNYPTTSAELDFTIEIEATDGNMSGKCRYSNGQFCSGSNYNDCNTRSGCTVSMSSGTATFVFSSS